MKKLQRQFKAETADGLPPDNKTQTVKPEEIFQHLGLKAENIKSLDDFKTEVNQNFIRRDQEVIRGDSELYGKLLGAKAKGTMTAAARAMRENGIALTDEDMQEPKLETFVENVIGKAAKASAEKIKELEKKLASAGDTTDEKVAKLQNELTTATTRLSAVESEWKQKVEQAETEWKQKFEEKANEFKNLNNQIADEKMWGGFKWASTADDLKREGFKSTVNKKAKFGFDETGKWTVFGLDGKRIPNPAVKDSFYEADDFIKAEGIKSGVYAISPHQGKGAPQKRETTTNPSPSQEGVGLKINNLRPTIQVRR